MIPDHQQPELQNPQPLSRVLERYNHSFHPVMHWPVSLQQLIMLDFTAANLGLRQANLIDTALFQDYITTELNGKQATMGIGGYLEHRVIYSRSPVFESTESRCIHLGVDLWANAFSPVYAPLTGKVHSFQDNNAYGDYGPTIILEHELENCRFYTLYGHLSRRSLENLREGQTIAQGAAFTELGPYPENGDWPPHLHFQLITDMEGRRGDFPGVAAPSELEKYRQLCPDPNLILNLDILRKTPPSTLPPAI